LKKLPSVEMVSVANAPATDEPSSILPCPACNWTNGSVGNARWRGVRLADVLKRAGIKDSGQGNSVQRSRRALGTMQDFRRTITVKKALDSKYTARV